MRISILGWGSLIWDWRHLPITGDWQRGGPVLPIEFSRISRSGERAGSGMSTAMKSTPLSRRFSRKVAFRANRARLRRGFAVRFWL